MDIYIFEMFIGHLSEMSSRQGKRGLKFQGKVQGKSVIEKKNDNAVDVIEWFKRLRNALRKVSDPLYDHIAISNVK